MECCEVANVYIAHLPHDRWSSRSHMVFTSCINDQQSSRYIVSIAIEYFNSVFGIPHGNQASCILKFQFDSDEKFMIFNHLRRLYFSLPFETVDRRFVVRRWYSLGASLRGLHKVLE